MVAAAAPGFTLSPLGRLAAVRGQFLKERVYIYIYTLPLPPRRIHHGRGGKPTWFEAEFELIRQEAGDKAQGPSQQEEQPQPGDGFAPRFDGLRFIETLITAHR
ncbi:unnamed protein product [Musa acuminata subsp. burmannicoides]